MCTRLALELIPNDERGENETWLPSMPDVDPRIESESLHSDSFRVVTTGGVPRTMYQ